MNNENKLIMTLLVRDEEDILESNICFHLNSGVNFIIAIDNGSVDNTPKILEKYQKKGVLVYKTINKHTYEQSLWVSQMAKLAVTKYDATHLFHCDADEFWYSQTGNLKDNLPKDNEIFSVGVINYIPPNNKNINCLQFKNFKLIISKPIPYPQKLCNLESHKVLLYQYPKKIMTTNQFLQIAAGNHNIISTKKYTTTNVNNLFIHHFPIRNYSHFKKRVINGGTAMINSPIKNRVTNWHIRSWYKKYLTNDLVQEYDHLSLKNKEAALLSQGVLKKIQVSKKIRFAKIIFKINHLLKN